MIVVDAGAVLELLLRTPAGLQVEEMVARHDLAAPDLVDAQVFSGLIRARKSGRCSGRALAERIELLRDMDIERYPARDLLLPARSCTAALSGYDALYAALALVLRCPVLTTDNRFAATAADQLALATICVRSSGRRAP